jgi:hypothetical protein
MEIRRQAGSRPRSWWRFAEGAATAMFKHVGGRAWVRGLLCSWGTRILCSRCPELLLSFCTASASIVRGDGPTRSTGRTALIHQAAVAGLSSHGT